MSEIINNNIFDKEINNKDFYLERRKERSELLNKLSNLIDNEEDTLKAVNNLSKQKDLVAKVLKNWRYLGEMCVMENLDNKGKKLIKYMFYWGAKREFDDHDIVVDKILWLGSPTHKTFLPEDRPLTIEDKQKLLKGGYGLFANWLEDPSFTAKDEIVEILCARLSSCWNGYSRYGYETSYLNFLKSELSSSKVSPKIVYLDLFLNELRESMHNVFRYANQKELFTPLFEKSIRSALKEKARNRIKRIFELFHYTKENGEAENLLKMDNLTKEERLILFVEYANNFGFIKTIDWLSEKIKNEKIPNNLKDCFKWIYKELQGEEAKRIVSSLTEIYQNIDFSKYFLNNPEVTKFEVDFLEEAINGLEKVQNNVNKYEIAICDVGAGTGRHSLELARRGYKNITAIDEEKKHIEFIQRQNPSIHVIQNDWHLLSRLDEFYRQKMDFVFMLGRSLTHNRRPDEMVHCFDQLLGIMSREGRLCFDFEDTSYGERGRRFVAFKENLISKGILVPKTGVIFDGPDDVHRYNRQVLNPEQIKALADLFGLKIIKTGYQIFGGGIELKNDYYLLEKDKNFNIKNVNFEEFKKNLDILGLINRETDFNKYIESWGMTIGQALCFGKEFGLGNEYLRKLNEEKNGPIFLDNAFCVKSPFLSEDLNFLSFSDENFIFPKTEEEYFYTIGPIMKGMSREEVENYLRDLNEGKISIGELRRLREKFS